MAGSIKGHLSFAISMPTLTLVKIAMKSNLRIPNQHLTQWTRYFKRVKLGTFQKMTIQLTGCRKLKGVNRFHDRTAGVLALVRPCGVIVNTTEMYTCESPTQVYLFLVMTFARKQDIYRLHYLGYDRACDLHPFLCNLERKGVYFA